MEEIDGLGNAVFNAPAPGIGARQKFKTNAEIILSGREGGMYSVSENRRQRPFAGHAAKL